MLQSKPVVRPVSMGFIMSKLANLSAALLCLLITGCGGGGGDNAPTQTPGNGSGNGGSTNTALKAFVNDSPYASVIADCVETTCTLEQMPLIGLTHDDPGVSDIMNHVVVSHDWMGQRFLQQLQVMPQEMRLLFRAVTAIVIASDIRPSHYRSDTGAIYLDPALLWLTNEEKATIDQTPDFRSNFGKDLQFVRLWRYVIDNDYAWRGYSLDGDEERTPNDTIVAFSWLLYHELAHANDCATPQNMVNFDRSTTFYQNHQNMVADNLCVYQQLTEQMGLQSQTWLDLARVFFHGTDSTSEQRTMTPEQAGDAFALDYAMDAYSYSSVREDVAMAFEAVMMKKNFNADRDMAIINQYQDDFACSLAQIKWGQRGRMALSDVVVRSKFVTDIILPTQDLTDFYNGLPANIDMDFNHNWCEPDLNRNKKAGAVDSEKFARDAASFIRHYPGVH